MKENEKKVSVLLEETGQSSSASLLDDDKSKRERLKKPLIYALMGIVFLCCMYLIFKPSENKNGIENIGLNDSVPQASGAGIQENKQKAYEQQMLEEKNQEKRSAMTSLSDYWNEENSAEDKEGPLSDDKAQDSGFGGMAKPGSPALDSYRNSQSALSSFYKDDNSETLELRRQLDELKEKLADKDVPKSVTVDDQLALMEKSYQMAAKYLPAGTNSGAGLENVKAVTSSVSQKEYFSSFTPAGKNIVSSLYREPSDSVFLADYSQERNRGFYTAGSATQEVHLKNSVKAFVQETQTIIGESIVRLHLLEEARTPKRTIPKGTLLTANAKFQTGRLQMKITSVELDGNIVPVDITIYDLDGQPGLNVPYSPEVSALNEMAGNMSQTGGTSVMLTQSAGQQMAADLSRGVVQGISGYFSKKVKTPKVILKAGHQVFLVSKK